MEDHDLACAEECRLGEDFLFYAEALIRGTVDTVLPHCGYAAPDRENSLSGRHLVGDLRALHASELQICIAPDFAPAERKIFKQRARSTLRRVHHREVLARKTASGSLLGAAAGITHPNLIIDIFRDRMRKTISASATQLPKRWLPAEYFGQFAIRNIQNLIPLN